MLLDDWTKKFLWYSILRKCYKINFKHLIMFKTLNIYWNMESNTNAYCFSFMLDWNIINLVKWNKKQTFFAMAKPLFFLYTISQLLFLHITY